MIGTEKMINNNEIKQMVPIAIIPTKKEDLVNSNCHVLLFKTDIKRIL
jgi:hypothetical protein